MDTILNFAAFVGVFYFGMALGFGLCSTMRVGKGEGPR